MALLGIPAIILSFILYCIIGISNVAQKDYPHGFIWFSYALSQLGFLWYEIIKKTTG